MIWEKTEVDPVIVKEISNRYGIDKLLASILVRRGITTPNDIKFYLESDTRFLHNPFLFNEMEDVIDRLHMAKDEGEKILVFGDKDVDGVTSSVILYQSLKVLEVDLEWKVPTGDDSYGLSKSVVEDAYNRDISLIITVDCGISAFEPIQFARELGMDVIVLDHHNSRDGVTPNANLIINPKLENSGYPFSGLAACGVVSKVVWALSFSFIESLYKSTLCFLHLEETPEGIVLAAVKLYNLIPISKIEINFKEIEEKSFENLINFLKGEQILVYGAVLQKALFRRLFGNGVDLNVLDIQPEIERIIPSLIGQKFERLISFSKIRLYRDEPFTQIDLLISLFTTYIEKRYVDSFEPFVKTLDLVALGTVADLMPLKDENRILVKKGLGILTKTDREGLQALMLKQNILGKEITSTDISWVLAPVINSAGRMKKADLAVDVLLCENRDLKNKLALDILALNKERRSISNSLWDEIYSELHESYEEFNQKLVVLYHKNMLKGVTGIIASKTQNIFSAPAIIIAKEGDELSGSIRSPGNLDINKFFNDCGDLLLEWGGHNCAAGFKLKYLDLSKFLNLVKKLVFKGEIIQKLHNKSDKLVIDAFIPSQFLTPDIIKTYDYFEPFGEGNKSLNFVTKRVQLLDITFMGKAEKKHIKLLIEIGEYKWPGIFWNSAEKVGREFTKGDTVDIAYKIERNFFGGNEVLQLNIMDIIK